MKKILLSAIQPTNDLTLGNYLGAINNFVKLQNDYFNIIFIADLHAITTELKPNLKSSSINLAKYYLASGLNQENTIFFKQSDILEHTLLAYFLLCNTTIGELNRMTQFKDKSSKIRNANNTEYIPTGLLVYPTLMAADILLYDADMVVVGADQKQHMELTKNIANRINNKLKMDIFKIPEIYIATTGSKIMDLLDPSKKMSKSSNNLNGVIFLSDTKTNVEKKVKGALTDNFNQVKYDPINQPGISNLITIYHLLGNVSISDIEKKYKDIENYSIFKKDLIIIINDFLEKLQKNYNKISDKKIIDILSNGAKKAKVIANKKINDLMNKMGF